MPDHFPHDSQAGRGGRYHGDSGVTEVRLRSRIRLLSVTPALTAAVTTSAAWAISHYELSAGMTWTVVVPAAVVTVAAMGAAWWRAARIAADVASAVRDQKAAVARHWNHDVVALAAEGHKDIAALLEQINRGERPQLPAALPDLPDQDGTFADSERTLRLWQHAALEAVRQAAERQQVDLFVNIAQRLHALVNRALARLDALELEVEDPDLLDGLFSLDHLVTQFRRQVESLAVLGGAVPRRVNKPVPLPAVFRQSISEIEQYARVRVIKPPEGTLYGFAAAEVVHLLAELAENAARFSAPTTQVEVRAEHVPAGLAIEIVDRGLPMSREKLEQMNQLLTAPDQFDIRRQFEDGQIGLFVVAQIARRHAINVVLQSNIFGGTTAVVVLPRALLEDIPSPDRPTAVPHPEAPAPLPAPEPARGDGSTRKESAAQVPGGQALSGGPVRHLISAGPVAAHAEGSGLPQRRATTPTPEPQARDASDSEGAASGPDVRPVLPKRSETYEGPRFGGPAENGDRQVVAPDPDLMARFTSGLRRAADDGTRGSAADRTS